MAEKEINEYNLLIEKISILLDNAKKSAYYRINEIMTRTYWEVGKQIVEYEQGGRKRAEYGQNVLERLSIDLNKKFEKGFSVDNLEKMRKFYFVFQNSETLSRKLSWSHFCLLMRLDNSPAREFYTIESEKETWSVRELERQINSMLFERIALSKDKMRELLR